MEIVLPAAKASAIDSAAVDAQQIGHI